MNSNKGLGLAAVSIFKTKPLVGRLFLVLAIVLGTLDPALAAPDYPYAIIDAGGREVSLDRPLNRIVSLNRQTSECIVALGGRDKIIAIGDDTVRNNPYLGLGHLPQIAGTGLESAEAIVALNPDAVLAYSNRSPYLETQLAGSGIKVIRLDNHKPETEDRELLLLGTLLDKENEAQDLLRWKKGLRELARAKVAALAGTQRKTVAAFLLSPLHNSAALRLYPAYDSTGAPGPGEGYAAILAGGLDACPSISSASGFSSSLIIINDEYLLKINPQVITLHGSIYGGYDGPGADEIQAIFDHVKKISCLALTEAGRNRRIFFFHSDMLGGNKREIGILQLMKYLYPESMADIEPLDYVREYFENRIGCPLRGTWFYEDGKNDPPS